MRNSIKFPKNRITQGTIFCGVKSPYPHLEHCHGICITARCDTARDFKAPNLTFLSIIPMHAWLWSEALPKAISDQKKSAIGTLRNHLNTTLGNTTVLDAFGEKAAFDAAGKTMTPQRKLYNDALDAEKISAYQWKVIPESIAKKVAAEGEQLLAGKIQDFHFIDNVEAPKTPNEKKASIGFVVNFRDIRSISRPSAFEILKGIDDVRLRELSSEDPSVNHLYADSEVFIYPTGELMSPYIEQLMQNFSLVYGRIGTKDIPRTYRESIKEILRSEN